jgi:hypothetical protein
MIKDENTPSYFLQWNWNKHRFWIYNTKNIQCVYWNHSNVFEFKGKPPGFTKYNYDWYQAQGKKLGQKRFLIVAYDSNWCLSNYTWYIG